MNLKALKYFILGFILMNIIGLGHETVLAQDIDLGTGILNNPVGASSEDADWQGDYVYYGTYDGKPVMYRVLDSDSMAYGASSVLLDCDSVLITCHDAGIVYDEKCNRWLESDIRVYLNTEFLANNFSLQEQEAMLQGNGGGGAVSRLYGECDWAWEGTPLGADRLFLLDVSDVLNEKYGYCPATGYSYDSETGFETIGVVQNRKKTGGCMAWWLRSTNDYKDSLGSYVNWNGAVDYGPVDCGVIGISPALAVDNSSVLFTSLVGYDKSRVSQVRKETENAVGSKWKFTLLDNYQLFNVDYVRVSGRSVNVGYTYGYGGISTSASQISIMVTDGNYGDNNASMVYYGKVGDIKDGKVTFTLPEEFGTAGDWKVYLFSECVNDGGLTDYASAPVEIDIGNAGSGIAPWLLAAVAGLAALVLAFFAVRTGLIKAGH